MKKYLIILLFAINVSISPIEDKINMTNKEMYEHLGELPNKAISLYMNVKEKEAFKWVIKSVIHDDITQAQDQCLSYLKSTTNICKELIDGIQYIYEHYVSRQFEIHPFPPKEV